MGLLAALSARRLHHRFGAPDAQACDLTREVSGMRCNHGVASVKRALEDCDSVQEAAPDLGSGLVCIRGDRLDATALIASVQAAGFSASRPGENRPD